MIWTVVSVLVAWVTITVPLGIVAGRRLRANRKQYPKIDPTDHDHPTFI